MTDPIKFILEIRTKTDPFFTVGFVPFEGAEFCAHRHIEEPMLWNVTHARTSLKLPIQSFGALTEAMDLARKLSEQCPAAADVTWDGTAEGDLGKASGPVAALARQVKAVLAKAA